MSSWIQRCKFDTPLLAAGSLIHFSHQQNGKLHILGNLIVTYKFTNDLQKESRFANIQISDDDNKKFGGICHVK